MAFCSFRSTAGERREFGRVRAKSQRVMYGTPHTTTHLHPACREGRQEEGSCKVASWIPEALVSRAAAASVPLSEFSVPHVRSLTM
ncbi:hypothetical protein PILCRDRAFT_812284 [Piloderma croceum F 1598]|uniref:Uncharacterized protein n=1 Tax=Piloderma croceum (strain F 1598) TaxID=765440 RepID=A0A0C3CLI3_PILCF|nr:hypothetical protein PILCRDRAFT_812284 [Piloderma croceum F 1598]